MTYKQKESEALKLASKRDKLQAKLVGIVGTFSNKQLISWYKARYTMRNASKET